MWTGETMTFLESLMVSGLGMFVVIVELAVLAAVLIVFSRIFAAVTGAKAQEASAISGGDGLNEEDYAVLIAAVSEELNMESESFQIVEIKEITEAQ